MHAFTSHRAALLGLGLLAALLLAVPATAAACGESAPPQIKSANVSPANLPWEGGTIVVTTEVESDCGLEIYAEVATSGGLQWSFQMLPSGDPNSALRFYKSEIGAPPNYDDEPFTYQIEIRALDDFEGSAEKYAGATELAAAPPFDEPPAIAKATVKPLRVGSGGGGVTISADITDNRGVTNAWAAVMLPDETIKDVTLNPVSATHYEGFFKAPANPGATPQQYPVVVYAEDESAMRDWEEAGTFTVSPLTGLLNAWTTEGSYFGRVAVGSTATRTVAVHNNGGPKTQPVEASITTSGAPFSIQGAIGGKVDFTIAAGETKTFVVAFSPTSTGYKTGSAIVSRSDGAQKTVSVSLSGQGT
jgi:Abnormal spindle-like microcephaly-assoc'd, ASPM-SPD-2-Hydin